MKSSIFIICFFWSTVVFASTWRCDLDAHVAGVLGAIGVGGKIVSGEGQLSCQATHSDGTVTTDTRSVQLTLAGFVRGFGLATINNITITGVGIGLDVIDDFYGKYQGVAGVEAGFLENGAGASISFGINNGAIGFEAQFSELDMLGFFAGVHISGLTISESLENDEVDEN